MSIVGLTIDYGPFGFMDFHDPDFICNGSGMNADLQLIILLRNIYRYSLDHEGRYAFKNQPPICKWNLQKLAQSIAPLLPEEVSAKILEDEYDSTYDNHFYSKMRRKVFLKLKLHAKLSLLQLGLVDAEMPEDKQLIDSLLQTMTESGSDFTNTFR